MATKSKSGTKRTSRSHGLAAAPARRGGLTRRGFLGTGVAGVVAARTVAPAAAQAAQGAKTLGPGKSPMTLTVNGQKKNVLVEPRQTLLRVLRNQLDVTGPKEVCDRGACGACSVIMDGKLVSACMVLAVDAAGKSVTTAEGLAVGGKLHPLQEAFVAHDALQCGFCTPGMVMACKAILDQHGKPTREQIKEGLAGNLCRCGTYTRVFEAVETAARKA